MANWGATYTIAKNPSASTGGNTSTTFNDTTQTFVAAHSGMMIRLLTGPGAGEESYITGINSTSQVQVSPAWTVTPDATTTYEVVLKFRDQDHITANTTISNLIITELENSGTVLVDGSYSISITGTSTVRWVKSPTTYVTFQANNRSSQGRGSFWLNINIASGFSGTMVGIKYIKICDSTSGFQTPCTNAAIGDGSAIRYIWIDNANTASLFCSSVAQDRNITIRDWLVTGCPNGRVLFPSSASAFTIAVKNFWFQDCIQSQPNWEAAGSALQIWDECVTDRCGGIGGSNMNSGKTAQVQDSYILPAYLDGCAWLRPTTTGSAGTFNSFRNVMLTARSVNVGVNTTSTFQSSFNDFFGKYTTAHPAFDIGAGTNFSVATSDNDFMAGLRLAAETNVDTSTGTSSSANPVQYQNLTANRTNPKSVRNRPLLANNVSVGTPTANSVAVTFDCENGAVAGQGSTTVDADSNSGQKVLNIADTTGYQEGETIEIARGTPRYETGVIASISAGVSVTLVDDLTFTHTAVQADTVKKRLRHRGIGFIRYGTASGVYDMQTAVPNRLDFPKIGTGFLQVVGGKTYDFKYVDHSVTLENLKPNTPYYAKAFFVTPTGEIGESTEFTFTTAAAAGGEGAFAYAS